MKTAVAAGSKSPGLDFKKSLLEAFAHHRGQIAMLARQVGYGVPAKAGFGLWGALWRECGFGK